MTWQARAMGWFPSLHLLAMLACGLWLCKAPGLLAGGALLMAVYGVAPLCMRLHQWLAPVHAGRSCLGDKGYCPWWGSHQLQVVYMALPFLEASLRIIPGIYSAWLRLWGSKIGCQVHWTPNIEITDRSLLEVGDHAVLGHRCIVFGHVVSKTPTATALLVNRVKIGAHALIGAGSNLGPGAEVAARALVPVCTNVFPNTRYPPEKTASLQPR